jgi:hypothetical protein
MKITDILTIKKRDGKIDDNGDARNQNTAYF